MARRRRKQVPSEPVAADIESLSHDGRGVAHIDGKATFVHGALPGERVMLRYLEQRRSYDVGVTEQVLRASALRVEPACSHFNLCGGCSLQHLESTAQIDSKQQILLDNLRQIGKVDPAEVLTPLRNDSPWGYRRKARLGVKFVAKKGKVLVGFRERGSAFVADLQECHVLHPKVGRMLPALSALIDGMAARQRIAQIEMAMDDDQCVLILRNLDPLNDADQARLLDFARAQDVFLYLQPGGPATVAPLAQAAELEYALPSHDVRLRFLPGDFTQVNTAINRQMVVQALDLLAVEATDRVLDLFCGVGNFTLPLARVAGAVVGVEGDAGLVERARGNARRNALHNVEFFTANLYEPLSAEPWFSQNFNKVLLDPPRSGALEVLEHLPRLGVERIVYVSCYPGTLARDAGELVHRHGYRLLSAGVMDMFPHTAHVESIAVFERGRRTKA